MLNMRLQISEDTKQLLCQSMLTDVFMCCAYYPDIERAPSTISSFGIKTRSDWIELYQDAVALEDGEYYAKLCAERKETSNRHGCYIPHNNIYWKRGKNGRSQSPLVGYPDSLFRNSADQKDKQVFYELYRIKDISIIQDSLTFQHPSQREAHHIEADIGVIFETCQECMIFMAYDKDFSYSRLYRNEKEIEPPLVFWSYKTDAEYCTESTRKITPIVPSARA